MDIAPEVALTDADPFGIALDLSSVLPPGTRTMVVAVMDGGLRPKRLILPHQLYTKDLDEHRETWVLPVVAPWFCVSGRSAGQRHPEREHRAQVIEDPETGKFCWSCAGCGAWSRGYRFKDRSAARRAAGRHDERATEEDRQIFLYLHGSHTR